MESAYLKFLLLKDKLIQSLNISLDALSEDVLEYIFKNTINNKNEIVVGDVLALKHLGSPATLHKRLHRLVVDKYLELNSTQDGRKKKVFLTKRGYQYFTNLNQVLVKAVSD